MEEILNKKRDCTVEQDKRKMFARLEMFWILKKMYWKAKNILQYKHGLTSPHPLPPPPSSLLPPPHDIKRSFSYNRGTKPKGENKRKCGITTLTIMTTWLETNHYTCSLTLLFRRFSVVSKIDFSEPKELPH